MLSPRAVLAPRSNAAASTSSAAQRRHTVAGSTTSTTTSTTASAAATARIATANNNQHRRQHRRGGTVVTGAATMPGLPTTGLGELASCVEAQQFDRAMLEELFVIADAMAEVRPGSPHTSMLAAGPHLSTFPTWHFRLLVPDQRREEDAASVYRYESLKHWHTMSMSKH